MVLHGRERAGFWGGGNWPSPQKSFYKLWQMYLSFLWKYIRNQTHVKRCETKYKCYATTISFLHPIIFLRNHFNAWSDFPSAMIFFPHRLEAHFLVIIMFVSDSVKAHNIWFAFGKLNCLKILRWQFIWYFLWSNTDINSLSWKLRN